MFCAAQGHEAVTAFGEWEKDAGFSIQAARWKRQKHTQLSDSSVAESSKNVR